MSFLGDLFGGGSSSSQANNTSSSTDLRRVYGDNATTLDNGSNLTSNSNNNIKTSSVATWASTANSNNTISTADNSTHWANSGNTISTASTDNSNTNSGNTISTSNSVNNTTNTLDGGAIGASFAASSHTADVAFGFGDHALGFGKQALDFSKDTLSTVVNSNDATVSNALAFVGHAQDKSYAASNEAFTSALNMVGQFSVANQKQNTQVIDAIHTSENQVSQAYADAKGRGAMTDYILLAAVAGAMFLAFKR